MSNDLVKTENLVPEKLGEIEGTRAIADALKKLPHYQRISEVEMFIIVQKALQMGISPLEALNGGMYSVKGKVELTAQMMNRLIRSKGHRVIQVQEKCTPTCCTLKGIRGDTGDEWIASWSLEDAQRAGLTSNDTWRKYPQAMCFARALSILARQLFPDVIVDTYVEGELRDDKSIPEPVIEFPKQEPPKEVTLSDDQLIELESLISETTEPLIVRAKIAKRVGTGDFKTIAASRYDALVKWLEKQPKVEIVEIAQEDYAYAAGL